jgi:Rieske Fe-S protein
MTNQSSRRQFLRWVSDLLGAIVAVILAVPLIGFSLAPLLQKRKDLWVRLGPLSDVKKDEPTKFVYSFTREDAYLQKVERGTVYVLTHDGRAFKVFSNICTHAGCGVRWEKGQGAFLCPCHNGRFDINGKVVAGPPPRPLNEMEHKVDGGVIFIKMEA